MTSKEVLSAADVIDDLLREDPDLASILVFGTTEHQSCKPARFVSGHGMASQAR